MGTEECMNTAAMFVEDWDDWVRSEAADRDRDHSVQKEAAVISSSASHAVLGAVTWTIECHDRRDM